MPESKYVDISELPGGPTGRNGRGRWQAMLDEFKAIPVGKYIEITDRLNGLSVDNAASGVSSMLRAAGVRGEITVTQRGGRLFVLRPKEAQR